MDHPKYILALVSTFSILVPIVFCRWALRRRAGIFLQLFFYFLLFGFLVDFLSWFSWILSSEEHFSFLTDSLMYTTKWMYEIYPVAEGMFFFWVIYRLSLNTAVKKVSLVAVILVLPSWVLFEFVIAPMEVFGVQGLGIFHMLAQW